jgi:L-ascorbate metabolism protein UlaG (beta-lactamase superfamily)
MEVQLLRHATLLVTINEKKILVDPMLSHARVMPPIQNSPNAQRNPLVELSIQLDLQRDIDGVLLTHTHGDHLDEMAIEQLPKNKPVLCQPEDEDKLKKLGFLEVHRVVEQFCWQEIIIHRTDGEHGTGEIAEKMGPVSGYVLQTKGEPSLYIAGDTIYCEKVSNVLTRYEPNVIVVNAGGARFAVGDPITMTPQDVAKVCRKAQKSKVIAVHMEAINHCLVSRADLRTYLQQQGLIDQVSIPMDGDKITLFN